MSKSVRAAVWLVVISCASAVTMAQELELADAQEPASRYAEVFCESDPDLNELRGQPITDLRLWKSNVKDVTPLKGMPIKKFVMFGCPVQDLSPLAGMPLENVWIGATEVTDFSPLKGMPLKHLSLFAAQATDLSFLRGMQLETLDLSVVGSGKVTDLGPLKGMQLKSLEFHAEMVTTGLDLVRAMKSLEKINGETPEEFWRGYDAEAPARESLRKAGINYRRFWISKDGGWTLEFYGDDIADLSVLKGLPVRSLTLDECEIKDLSPLRDMKITKLNLQSPTLNNLRSLKGAPLTDLVLSSPKIEDLSPLKGMALKKLHLRCPKVTNVSALKGMPLKTLSILDSNIRDITPLEGAALSFLLLHAERLPKGMEVLRRMKTLEQINYNDAESVWEKFDAGDLDRLSVPQWMLGWD